MVTPIFGISDTGRASSARSPRADDECLRYRLDVVATSAVDVVQSAGGWLYDRRMAGWEVTVLLPDGIDTRPLRILGLRTLDLESDFTSSGVSHSFAASAEAFAGDERVREKVRKALDHSLTEVALWGSGWPPGIESGMARVQHMLSSAARVFKGYALAAAGIPRNAVGPTETMQCDMAPCLPVDSHLIRLG